MLVEQAHQRVLTERVVGAVFAAAGAEVVLPEPIEVREQVLAMLHDEPAEVDQDREDWLLVMGLR